jgi:hypothetical protein
VYILTRLKSCSGLLPAPSPPSSLGDVRSNLRDPSASATLPLRPPPEATPVVLYYSTKGKRI